MILPKYFLSLCEIGIKKSQSWLKMSSFVWMYDKVGNFYCKNVFITSQVRRSKNLFADKTKKCDFHSFFWKILISHFSSGTCSRSLSLCWIFTLDLIFTGFQKLVAFYIRAMHSFENYYIPFVFVYFCLLTLFSNTILCAL